MKTNELLSFLESASSRPTYRPEEEHAEPAHQQESQEVPTALTPEEQAEYIRTAMRNLGLASPDRPEPEPTEQAPSEVVERYVAVFEEAKEEIPEMEKPLAVPEYSSVREELIRFSDAEWFKKVQEKVVVLAGVGGIGSNMAVILAKLNPKAIYIFDDDTVESYNLAGQFYSNDDIGKPKVDALATSVVKYTNYSSIFALNRKYIPGEEIVADIMICGFDNMLARRTYFNAWKSYVDSLPEERRKDCLYMDGRLTADEFQIFSIVGDDKYYIEEYDSKYLFKDYEAQREVCSFKQTGFLADMIGAFMVNLFVNFCANQVNPAKNMTVPFKTSYRSSMMFLDMRR